MLPSFEFLGRTVYLYPLMMGLAWGIAYSVAHKLCPKNIKNLNFILLGIFSSSWIGAKIFFLLTSEFIDKSEFVTNSNFWLGGGFVFYGGLIFGLSFTFLYSKVKNIPINSLSFLIIPLGIGHGLGRIGCFLAGCCHGVVIEFERVDFHTPVQLIESTFVFVITFIAFKKFKEGEGIISFYLVSYAVLRFFLEFLRSDQIRGQFMGLSTSQAISVGLIVAVLITKRRAILSSDKR